MADRKFVFLISSANDRPDVVAGAFQLAVNMQAFDAQVDFFLMDQGTELAKKGFAETLKQRPDQFSPAAELIKTLTEDFGANFYICASCVKAHGIDKAELIPNAEVKPGSFLGEMLMERQCLTF